MHRFAFLAGVALPSVQTDKISLLEVIIEKMFLKKNLLELDTYLILILYINLVTAPGAELLMQFGLFGYSPRTPLWGRKASFFDFINSGF